jgi:phage shock protein A
MLEIQQSSVEMAGHSRLEQIRASMRGDQLPAGGTAATAPATPATNKQPAPENPLSQ